MKIISEETIYEKAKCNIEQQFALESTLLQYETISKIFNGSSRTGRYQSSQLPKTMRTVSNEGSYVKTIHIFNSLLN